LSSRPSSALGGRLKILPHDGNLVPPAAIDGTDQRRNQARSAETRGSACEHLARTFFKLERAVTQLLVRLYESESAAAQAVRRLRHRFTSIEVHLIPQHRSDTIADQPDPALSDIKGADQAIAASLARSGIWESHVEAYVQAIREGGSLVLVEAPFGAAVVVRDILQGLDPVNAGSRVAEYALSESHNAAPLSAILNLPVLVDDPAPLSRLLGLPLLARGSAFLSSLFGPLLSRNPAPLSALTGMPLLLHRAAPLSSALRLPLLADGAAPLSSLTRLPLLSRRAAPLSSWLGLPLLVRNPAPLSSLLRLPVLIESRSTYDARDRAR
jgi:hypothetical protein